MPPLQPRSTYTPQAQAECWELPWNWFIFHMVFSQGSKTSLMLDHWPAPLPGSNIPNRWSLPWDLVSVCILSVFSIVVCAYIKPSAVYGPTFWLDEKRWIPLENEKKKKKNSRDLMRVVKCNQPTRPWQFDGLPPPLSLPTSDTCLNDGGEIEFPFIRRVFKKDDFN